MNATSDSAIPPVASPRRRGILILIATIFIVAGVLWAVYYTLVLARQEVTDDSYVNANKVVVSSQVAGTVVAVNTDDTQLVRAGQVLVRLDPADAATALSRAGNLLAQAVRQVRSISGRGCPPAPRKGASGLAGNRVEPSRAGITITRSAITAGPSRARHAPLCNARDREYAARRAAAADRRVPPRTARLSAPRRA